MEETVVEREVEEAEFIPSVIRRLSAIDSLITEARFLSQLNSSHTTNDDLAEKQHHGQDYRHKRRQALHNISEAISEEDTDKV